MNVRSEIIIPKTETKPFLVSKNLAHAQNDNVSGIILNNDTRPIELDISSIESQNIRHLTIQDGVTLVLNQSDLKGMQVIDGAGNIKAMTGLLDLVHLQISKSITILDDRGIEVPPTFIEPNAADAAGDALPSPTLGRTDESSMGGSIYTFTGDPSSTSDIDSIFDLSINVPVEQREFSLNNVRVNVIDAKKSTEFTPLILATLLYLVLVTMVI